MQTKAIVATRDINNVAVDVVFGAASDDFFEVRLRGALLRIEPCDGEPATLVVGTPSNLSPMSLDALHLLAKDAGWAVE